MFDIDNRTAVVAELRRKLGALGGVSWGGQTRYDASLGAADSVPAGPTGFDPEGSVLAVPEPIAALLPAGGVPRGSVVTVGSAAPGRSGATSLLLTFMAAQSTAQPGAWIAAVGLPDLGLLAAAELGVDLSRLGLVPDPGPDLLQVISILADGVDVIATVSPLGLPGGLPPAPQRVVTGRLRDGGAVLLVAGRWPGADLAFTVRDVRWSGIGEGFGRLRDREIDVEIGGRRAGRATGAVVTLVLRAGRGAVTVDQPDTAAQRKATLPLTITQADVG